MRDQQSSDTSIALDANTDVQQEADKPAVKWRYLFGFLAWTVLNAIAFYMTASIMIPQRLKDIGVANPDATLGAINAAGAGQPSARRHVQHRHDDPQLQSRVPHRHRHRTVRWRVGLDHQAHQVIQTGPYRRI